jgi:hypothetical protein
MGRSSPPPGREIDRYRVDTGRYGAVARPKRPGNGTPRGHGAALLPVRSHDVATPVDAGRRPSPRLSRSAGRRAERAAPAAGGSDRSSPAPRGRGARGDVRPSGAPREASSRARGPRGGRGPRRRRRRRAGPRRRPSRAGRRGRTCSTPPSRAGSTPSCTTSCPSSTQPTPTATWTPARSFGRIVLAPWAEQPGAVVPSARSTASPWHGHDVSAVVGDVIGRPRPGRRRLPDEPQTLKRNSTASPRLGTSGSYRRPRLPDVSRGVGPRDYAVDCVG